jgi:hypothetical protein
MYLPFSAQLNAHSLVVDIAMKIQALIYISLIFSGWLSAQSPRFLIDTLPTERDINHIHLNIRIPNGEVFMQSSNLCGSSITKLHTHDKQLKHRLEHSKDAMGNPIRTLHLEMHTPEELRTKNITQNVSGESSGDFSRQVFKFNNYGEHKDVRSVYNPDPSVSTDLYLDLGIGRSRLDLSDLSLNKVEIHSAFSDLHLTYNLPNRVQMEKMDIHAAKAKIVLKNLDMARANIVSIVNDMGDTKMVLGDGQYAGTTIYVQQGMGDCTLILHPKHPIRIVLKSGIFSSSTLPEGFTKAGNTFLNATGQLEVSQARREDREPRLTTIVCTVDFGSVSVFLAR